MKLEYPPIFVADLRSCTRNDWIDKELKSFDESSDPLREEIGYKFDTDFSPGTNTFGTNHGD